LAALVNDFQKEIKFVKHVDFVVCWTASDGYSTMLELKPLLVGSNGNDRVYFGATHAAYRLVGGTESEFEVIILQDLVRYLLDPKAEEARQRAVYGS
jgi:hypothetical protein